MLAEKPGRTLLAGLLSLALVACAIDGPPEEPAVTSDTGITHRAVFIGRDGHDTFGSLSVYGAEQPALVVFDPGFRSDAAAGADPVVAFGRDGYRANAVIGALRRPAGTQAYAVPQHLDVSAFNEVWLWSRSADAPLGLGRLTPVPEPRS